MSQIDPQIELDSSCQSAKLNDATNNPCSGRTEYSWSKASGHFLDEENAGLAVGVAEGRRSLPCLQGGQVGRHFCILQRQCSHLIQFQKLGRGQTYNKGAENKYWLRLLDTSRGNLR